MPVAKIKKGDTAYIKCVGYGYTTYEKSGEVTKVAKDKIYLNHDDNVSYAVSTGFSSNGDVLGLRCDLCITEEQIAKAKVYIEEHDKA